MSLVYKDFSGAGDKGLDHLEEVGLKYRSPNSGHSLMRRGGLLSDKAGAEIQPRCQSFPEESVLED